MHQNICPLNEPVQFMPAFRGSQVQAHSTLVDIDREKEATAIRVRPVIPKRTSKPGRVAGRWFDLNNIGAMITQQLRGIGSRDPAAKLENVDWFLHCALLPGLECNAGRPPNIP